MTDATAAAPEPSAFEALPTIPVVLAGKTFRIPELGWPVMRYCRSQLLELQDRLNAYGNANPAPKLPDDATPEAIVEAARDHSYRVLGGVMKALSNEDFEGLVVAPVYHALTALHPDLTREAYDAWPVTEFERQTAWLAVRTQSGLFVLTRAGADDADDDKPEGDEPPGESGGAA